MNKLMEGLVSDLKNLLIEAKKKHPQVKEVGLTIIMMSFVL